MVIWHDRDMAELYDEYTDVINFLIEKIGVNNLKALCGYLLSKEYQAIKANKPSPYESDPSVDLRLGNLYSRVVKLEEAVSKLLEIKT